MNPAPTVILQNDHRTRIQLHPLHAFGELAGLPKASADKKGLVALELAADGSAVDVIGVEGAAGDVVVTVAAETVGGARLFGRRQFTVIKPGDALIGLPVEMPWPQRPPAGAEPADGEATESSAEGPEPAAE
jgi:hypothetical protein